MIFHSYVSLPEGMWKVKMLCDSAPRGAFGPIFSLNHWVLTGVEPRLKNGGKPGKMMNNFDLITENSQHNWKFWYVSKECFFLPTNAILMGLELG